MSPFPPAFALGLPSTIDADMSRCHLPQSSRPAAENDEDSKCTLSTRQILFDNASMAYARTHQASQINATRGLGSSPRYPAGRTARLFANLCALARVRSAVVSTAQPFASATSRNTSPSAPSWLADLLAEPKRFHL